jgi:pantoate--beta-alanine ligase
MTKLSSDFTMRTIRNITEMTEWSQSERQQGRRIAFVPTMGALHEGHLSLVRKAKKRADRVVVSVFVNPAQFAPAEDFAAYPRNFGRDSALLEREAIDVLFHPAAEDIYPPGNQTYVEVRELSNTLCGAQRPGHFRGVATVVTKLFNVVRPHVAIFGEKDYQQLQIIRRLVRDLFLDVEIVGHPIVRESDGVAMSSRNAYLDADERKAARCLSRSLHRAECLVRQGETSAKAIVEVLIAELRNEPLAVIEYVAISDVETLEPLEQIRQSALLALSVTIGQARLIDNKVLLRSKRIGGGRGARKD